MIHISDSSITVNIQENPVTVELSNIAPESNKRIELAFNQSNLNANGVLPINHNLNASTLVTIKDNQGEVVHPDSIKDEGVNTVLITLKTFTPLTGNWKYIVEA